MDAPFERIDRDVKYEGHIGTLSVETFRYDDGGEATREVFDHPGAVGILALDDDHVWLVRQPREAVGELMLEIPAGKYDVEGEDSLETAKRELAEEIGKAAEHWEPLPSLHTAVGYSNERLDLWLATGLSDDTQDSEEEERIEIVKWPLSDLDGAIAATTDSKTLVALLTLALRRERG
jgi:8-oxo-dGTP pyrophosphatase MutT (NUDIX family)